MEGAMEEVTVEVMEEAMGGAVAKGEGAMGEDSVAVREAVKEEGREGEREEVKVEEKGEEKEEEEAE
jgi:hypothetical protein